MARICSICDKRPRSANLVSHARNRTGRWLYPNVHTMRFKVVKSSTPNKVYRGAVCTKCVKAGKIQKVI